MAACVPVSPGLHRCFVVPSGGGADAPSVRSSPSTARHCPPLSQAPFSWDPDPTVHLVTPCPVSRPHTPPQPPRTLPRLPAASTLNPQYHTLDPTALIFEHHLPGSCSLSPSPASKTLLILGFPLTSLVLPPTSPTQNQVPNNIQPASAGSPEQASPCACCSAHILTFDPGPCCPGHLPNSLPHHPRAQAP